MHLVDLIQRYGYAVVFFGSLLEGETVLALAGFAVHRGYLALPLVIATACAGGFLGDEFYFVTGRYFGPHVLNRFPNLQPGATWIAALAERRGSAALAAVRFLYGLRIVGPIAIGMSGVSWAKFLVINLASAAVWSCLFVGLGYVFGQTLALLLGDLEEIEHWLFGALLIAGVAAGLVARVHRRPAAGSPVGRARQRAGTNADERKCSD